jgi:hypothetical protein
MEDQKYALFTALVDRDKAVKEEADAINQLTQTIKQAYNTLKEMEIACTIAKETIEIKENNYNKALKDNKLGLVNFTSLEAIRDDLYSQNQSLYEMTIEYAKALSSFDLSSSGYISNLLTDGAFEKKDYLAGETFSDKATWYIKNTLTEYNFIFGVNIPKDYGVNFYQLYYGETKIADKTPIEDTIIHLPITYSDSTHMSLKLYNDDTVMYTADFDGSAYGGELKLQKVQDIPKNPEENTVGVWTLEPIDALRYKFTVNITADYSYDSYSVMYKDTVIAQVPKTESVQTLKLYFSSIQDLTIKLMKNGKELKTVYLKKSAEGDNRIVDKN